MKPQMNTEQPSLNQNGSHRRDAEGAEKENDKMTNERAHASCVRGVRNAEFRSRGAPRDDLRVLRVSAVRFLVAALLLCVHPCSSVVSFCAVRWISRLKDDGGTAMGEHTLGSAPEQHLSNRTVSVGTHDEKICASTGHELADQFRGPGADNHLFSRRHAVVIQIGLSRREDFLSGLPGARHIRERTLHPMSGSKHRRHDKGAGGMNASVVRNQYVTHLPKFLSRHQHGPDRTADYGRDQRIQIVALASLSVTF